MVDLTVERGNTIYVSVNFFDSDGNAASPGGAELRVAYGRAGTIIVTDAIAMQSGTDGWTAAWNTSPADPGTAEWTARSTDDPSIVAAGSVLITANASNPRA